MRILRGDFNKSREYWRVQKALWRAKYIETDELDGYYTQTQITTNIEKERGELRLQVVAAPPAAAGIQWWCG